MALVAWYRLDGNTNDSSGNGYNGTVSGATTSSDGRVGTSYFFNGSSQRLIFNYPSAFSFRSDFTLSAFIKVETPNDGVRRGFINNWTGTSREYELCKATDGKLEFRTSTNGLDSGQVLFFSQSAIPANQWTHVAVIFRPGIDVRFYINGVLDVIRTNTSVNPLWSASVNALSIGGIFTQYFIGNIDEVRIYNHSLSANEIRDIYRTKVLHYQFNSIDEEVTVNLLGTNGSIPTLSGWDSFGFGSRGTRTFAPEIQPRITGNTMRITNNSSTNGNTEVVRSIPLATGFQTGEKVTLTGYVRGEGTSIGKTCFPHIYAASATGNLSINGPSVVLSSDWKKIRYVFTWTREETSTLNMNIYFYVNMNIGESFLLSNVQVERRDYDTPFVAGTRNIGIADISGYGNNATVLLANSPSFSTFTNSGSGSFLFDGVDDYVSPTLQIQSGQEFSFSAWVYSTETGSLYRNVFETTDSGTPNPMIWFNTTGRIEFDKGSNYLTPSSYRNQWVHVAMTKPAGSSLARYYVNGQFMAQSNSAYTVPSATLSLGRRAANPNEYWKGYMSDVRFYSTQLSDADILELYRTKAQIDTNGNLFVGEYVQNKETTIGLNLENIFETNNMVKSYTLVNATNNGIKNNRQYFTATAQFGGPRSNDFISDISVNDKIYYGGTWLSTVSNVSVVITGNISAQALNHPNPGSFAFNSGIWTYPTANTNMAVTIYDYRTGSFTQSAFGKLFAINLTKIFGAGAEPTKTQMDEWYQQYHLNKIDKTSTLLSTDIDEIGPTIDLVGWWPLDGDLFDYSGNNRTLTNDGAVVASGIGKYKSYLFDASDELMSTNNITTGATVTVSAWGFRTAKAQNMLFSLNQTSGPDLWFADPATDRIFWNIGDGYSNPFRNEGVDVIQPSLNEWHHYVVVNSQALNKAILYVDGFYYGEALYRNTIQTNKSFIIGNYVDLGSSFNWDGRISDVRLYNGALSANEIKLLYDMKRTPMQFLDNTVYIAGEFNES
jgi:hypothetical protein